MDVQMRKKHRRKQGLSLGRRLLAVFMALIMVLGTSDIQLKKVSAESSDTTPINLANYLTDSSTMHITVYIDGVKHTYTPDELTQKGLVVPKGAPVKVELFFNTISNVKKGQTLVYQLPDNLMDYSAADENGYVWQDIVWEENNAGAEVEAADWVIDKNGKLTVTIRDDFFEDNKHDDGTLDLFGFNIKFSGSLSKNRGENSGNGDDVVTFRGETNGTGNISFTIPFEYLNENADVEVAKRLVSYDVTTKKASYEIKVTAPDTNIYTAKDVVVTDKIQCDSSYIETTTKDKVTYVYQNYSASNGNTTFDASKGIWTIGDMTAGQTETLTYDLIISDSAYKSGAIDKIKNVATVDFNDDGVNQSYATLTLPSAVLNKESVVNENKSLTSTDAGGTYMTYKLTVTANKGDEANLRVEDSFGDASLIKKIVAADNQPTAGTVTIDNDNASLTWTIDKLASGKTATLIYKAYLEEDAWQTTASTRNGQQYVSKKVQNKASLYIGDGVTETPGIADTDSSSDTIEKTWVKKVGEQITDKNDEKYGLLKYTVKVNGDPISDNVTTIYDTLTSGGTYESGGYLTVDRYTSSDETELYDTTKIPLSEIVSADGSGYRWDLDLVSRKLDGAYFYVLTYYVSSSAIQVLNNAGIGFGVGPGYGVGTQVQGGGGMTYGTDYSKSPGTDNKQEAYTPWTVTVQKTIPAGAVYVDRLSAEYVYKHEQFWFDDACLKDIEITFNNTTLVQGVDYTVKGVVNDDTGWASKTDPDGLRYSQFEITFNNEYAASSDNKLIISYKQRLNTEPRDEDVSYSDGCSRLGYNYCRWRLPEYGKLTETAEGANYSRGGYDWDTPLKKDNGTYDADKGTITWKLTVNTNTTIDGDAVIEEYLPAGLTFVSAEISEKPFYQLTKDTELGDVTQETYTDADGNECVKVNIPIKNLHAYMVTSSRFESGVGPYTGWTRAGEVTVSVVTKVDEEWFMNLTSDENLTNKAVLTDNDDLPVGGVTATGTHKITYTKLVDKSMAGKENPAYVEYALNINPNGDNIISGTNDNLEVVDIMGKGMKLATAHANSFKVYDVSKVSDLLDDDGNVIVSKAKTGEDVTDQCTVKDITGQELDGMTDDDKGKPAYLITVPDGKHLVVVYWATYEAAEDEEVTVTNKASFFYNNALQSGGGDETSDKVVASAASSNLFVGAFFYLSKSDQWGNGVPGVTYNLYEVSVDSSGNESGRTLVMSQTTGDDGTVYFGHRSGDSNTQLLKNKLYCLVEESAPVGYAVDATPYYFEFKTADHGVLDHPSGVTLHQFISGGTYSFTNQLTPASYQVPVKKTINGKNITGDTEFSFTLKQESGETVYTDESCSKAITKAGISTTITGSGETVFDNLYFTKVGTYTFSLTEDNLSSTAVSNGYTKDTNTFTVTIVVEEGDNKDLVINNAGFVSTDSSVPIGDLSSSTPTFNNKSTMTGTITLKATKEVTNRALPVQEGEFAFTVSVGGEVIAEKNEDGTTKLGEDGKPVKKLFYTKAGGDIEINLDVNQDDVGTKTYVISEVAGDDDTIKYTTDRVRIKVTIAEAGGGKVVATDYEPLTDTVFTNEYKASGSVTLEGTKLLKGASNGKKASVYDGEFNFIVKEGDTQVATGTNKADGSITFTDITYDASDIGVHTYVISEKDEGKAFVNYTDQTVKVKVTVTDAGNGKLNTAVGYVEGTLDDNGHALFTNTYTLVVPTGISLDIWPYVFVVALAGGAAAWLMLRRRKRRR
jgi:pilin isopeptide linkage protein